MNEQWRSRLWAILLSVLGVTGSIGAMVTGLWLPASLMIPAAFVAAATALLLSVCMARKGWWLLPCGLVLLGLLLWLTGPLDRSTEVLARHASRLYNLGYGWSQLQWSDAPLTDVTPTLALCFLALPITLAVCLTVIRGYSAWLGTVAIFLPLVPCMVLTDTVPGAAFVFLQFLSLGLLLLTQPLRSRSQAQGNRLSLLCLLPVTLALAALFLLMPQDGYTGHQGVDMLDAFIGELIDRRPSAPGQSGDPQPDSVTQLSNQGYRFVHNTPVMTVQTSQAGTLYLRGTAYDTYDGASWQVTAAHASDNDFLYAALPTATLTVSTGMPHDVIYTPYGALGVSYLQGRVDNPQKLTDYTLAYCPQALDTIFGDGAADRYLQYPRSLQQPLDAYAQSHYPQLIGRDADLEIARAIVEHVRGSATYNLRTPRMGGNEDDFVLWFLERSDTGYCIHFASAATVLLRHAGIPARYITGYAVPVYANKPTTVTDAHAHAWLEVYISGLGWVPLDPTPADLSSTVNPQPSQPAATDPVVTDPPETADPTVTDPPETAGDTVPPQTDPSVTTAAQSSVPPASTGSVAGSDPKPTPWDPASHRPSPIHPAIVWCVGILCVIAAIVLQWKLRVFLAGRATGSPNDQALAKWRQIERCARALGVQPDARLEQLAQKARFSQHTLTGFELLKFDFLLRDYRREIMQAPLFLRLYYRLVLALC